MVVKTKNKVVNPVVKKTEAKLPKKDKKVKPTKPQNTPKKPPKKVERVVNHKEIKKVEEIKQPVKFTPPGVGGRPPKYKTVAELDKLIDQYFESCWSEKLDMFGNVVFKKVNGKKTDQPVMVQTIPYTFTGLALAIGTTRETLLDYEHKDKFSDSVKRAKSICQQYAEQSLFIGKNPTGAIFNLKNNYKAWKDKTETEHSGNVTWNEILPK